MMFFQQNVCFNRLLIILIVLSLLTINTTLVLKNKYSRMRPDLTLLSFRGGIVACVKTIRIFTNNT